MESKKTNLQRSKQQHNFWARALRHHPPYEITWLNFHIQSWVVCPGVEFSPPTTQTVSSIFLFEPNCVENSPGILVCLKKSTVDWYWRWKVEFNDSLGKLCTSNHHLLLLSDSCYAEQWNQYVNMLSILTYMMCNVMLYHYSHIKTLVILFIRQVTVNSGGRNAFIENSYRDLNWTVSPLDIRGLLQVWIALIDQMIPRMLWPLIILQLPFLHLLPVLFHQDHPFRYIAKRRLFLLKTLTLEEFTTPLLKIDFAEAMVGIVEWIG